MVISICWGLQVNLNPKTVIQRGENPSTRIVKHLAFRPPGKNPSFRAATSDDEDEVLYDDTCIFSFKFFRWQREHRSNSLRDFVIEFRKRRLNNYILGIYFWQSFQPSERQRRIWKRRYSIVPYKGEPFPLNVVHPPAL